MAVDLHDLANQVADESSLIKFVSALARDREDEIAKKIGNLSSPFGSGKNGWENSSIESFLEAASAWATESENGMPHYTPPTNPWTRMAHILHMGKIYE